MRIFGVYRIATCVALFFGGLASAFGQVEWLSWEDAQSLHAKEPRKFIVDVYTQWCGWCKKMDKATFQHPEIAEYINEHYYAIKFDAESRDDIHFKGKTYRYIRSGNTGYNELAPEILFGKLSFPTIVFLDENLNVIQPIPGYKDAPALDKIMKYFAEDYYKNTPWKKYELMYIQGGGVIGDGVPKQSSGN